MTKINKNELLVDESIVQALLGFTAYPGLFGNSNLNYCL